MIINLGEVEKKNPLPNNELVPYCEIVQLQEGRVVGLDTAASPFLKDTHTTAAFVYNLLNTSSSHANIESKSRSDMVKIDCAYVTHNNRLKVQ